MAAGRAIECQSLVVRLGEVQAVDGVSFDVPSGALFAFLGPNGAGKSTTISVLCTLRPPTSGIARVAGFDTVREAREVRARLGVLFQDPTLDDRLTGRENLWLHARVFGVAKSDRARRTDEAIDLTGLGDAIDRQTRTYSGGMKRRLELARVLLHRPDVVVLDEPTAGLDPQTRRLFWESLADLRQREGTTVFLTTHYMEEAEQADRVAIIDAGKIIANGTPNELRRDVPVSIPVRAADAPRATLEDVFVHLTGRRIRDGRGDGREALRASMTRRGRI